MARATRKEVRGALGAALEIAMTTCEVVNNYFQSDLVGKSPLLNTYSNGTNGKPLTFQGLCLTYHFDIVVYVRRSGNVIGVEAQDELDGVSQQLLEFVESDFRNEIWESLDYAGKSEIVAVKVGGASYWQEITPLTAEVFSG